ncbi:MAG: PstS family phosphate ABC transporter substrate-binding protein [Nitrospira sp.]|nr:PstS family phosphate ABC transporter substrate-binding protein [Nitrospira sp.]MCP9460868.1 PstS family phosphate ABC transporter substrate-binding protein [Nitrospira sp.]MCP9473811.1 PstS family phosphate ABC transporter substrate-binding protein [Nitrospira sp.]
MRRIQLVGCRLAVGLLTLSCLWNEPVGADQSSLIKVDGSSTVYPVTEAVAEEFQNAHRGKIRVTVGIAGSGGGFKKFCRGEIDIADASRPILKEEMALCQKNGITYYELPVAFDALTVAVSPKNTWVDSMTVEELKKIWEPAAQGKIMRWNQVRPTWPDAQLVLFGAGSDSGTFDYFTDAIVGKPKSSRGDYTASEDDNVLVQGIERNIHSLGYVPYAYYAAQQKKLKAVAIVGKNGPVLPSVETVRDGSYQPLARPLFIYVNSEAAKRPEVRQFVEYYLTEGPKLIAEVRYVPLPDQAYGMARERFAKGVVGTGFGGEPEVGLPVEEIMKRPPKQ